MRLAGAVEDGAGMSFDKWMKSKNPKYKKSDDTVITRALRMAYAAGERQGRKDVEAIAKNAIELREKLKAGGT